MRSAWIVAGIGLAWVLGAGAADVDVVYTHADGRVERRGAALAREGDIARFRLGAGDIPSGVRHVEVHPSFATAKAGDPGYFVMPNGYLGTFQARDGEQTLGASCMPIFGMKGPAGNFVAVVRGMRHSYALVARARGGVTTLFPRFQLDGRAPYADIAIDFHMLPEAASDYSAMARVYRGLQLGGGACVPLSERVRSSPELAYAARSVEVRIRQGWKPAPSPVEEQTPATEPEMRVAVPFARVGQILDEFRRGGIDRAEVCLVGWNRKGHDGRYPQLFPVEERLGGERALRDLIAKARGIGYQIVAHSNSSDAYRISEVWDEEYVIKGPDGALSKNASWSGGRAYNVCPRRAYERFAPADLRAIAGLGFRGVHYIDVLTIVRPRACYDPRHPLDPDASAAWIGRIMAEAKGIFGGVASEGPFDFCCGDLDYVLYVSFAGLRKLPPLIDRIVPIWQLVYHGIIMSNPFADTTNYTIKDDVARLKLVEFGGRPMFYFHSKFLEGNKEWMGKEDLTCDTDAALVEGVARIRRGHDEYAALCHLQTEFLDRHEQIAPEVFRISYSNGAQIVVNYGAGAFVAGDMTVPPRDYRLRR